MDQLHLRDGAHLLRHGRDRHSQMKLAVVGEVLGLGGDRRNRGDPHDAQGQIASDRHGFPLMGRLQRGASNVRCPAAFIAPRQAARASRQPAIHGAEHRVMSNTHTRPSRMARLFIWRQREAARGGHASPWRHAHTPGRRHVPFCTDGARAARYRRTHWVNSHQRQFSQRIRSAGSTPAIREGRSP